MCCDWNAMDAFNRMKKLFKLKVNVNDNYNIIKLFQITYHTQVVTFNVIAFYSGITRNGLQIGNWVITETFLNTMPNLCSVIEVC